MSGVDFTGTTYPLGPLPPVAVKDGEVVVGDWKWDMQTGPPTVEDAKAVLAAALWFASPGLHEEVA